MSERKRGGDTGRIRDRKDNQRRQQTKHEVELDVRGAILRHAQGRRHICNVDKVNRAAALKEVATVGAEYEAFLSGEGDRKFIVSAEKINNRLDVKSCLMSAGRMVPSWKKQGFDVISLEDLVEPKVFS